MNDYNKITALYSRLSVGDEDRDGQTIVAELFFNHSGKETFSDKLLKVIVADNVCLSSSDSQDL